MGSGSSNRPPGPMARLSTSPAKPGETRWRTTVPRIRRCLPHEHLAGDGTGLPRDGQGSPEQRQGHHRKPAELSEAAALPEAARLSCRHAGQEGLNRPRSSGRSWRRCSSSWVSAHSRIGLGLPLRGRRRRAVSVGLQEPILGEDACIGSEGEGDRVRRSSVDGYQTAVHLHDQFGVVGAVLHPSDEHPLEGSAQPTHHGHEEVVGERPLETPCPAGAWRWLEPRPARSRWEAHAPSPPPAESPRGYSMTNRGRCSPPALRSRSLLAGLEPISG